jgi:hypothetical protein
LKDRKGRENMYQKGVFESLLFRNIDSIPISDAVSRGKLHVIVEL